MEADVTQKGKESTPQNCLLVRGQVDDTIGDNEVEGRVRELQLFDVAANKRKIAGQSAAFFKLSQNWMTRFAPPRMSNFWEIRRYPPPFLGELPMVRHSLLALFLGALITKKNQDRIVTPPPLLNEYRFFQIFGPFYKMVLLNRVWRPDFCVSPK